MHSNFDLSKSSFSDGFSENILSDLAFVWLELQLDL